MRNARSLLVIPDAQFAVQYFPPAYGFADEWLAEQNGQSSPKEYRAPAVTGIGGLKVKLVYWCAPGTRATVELPRTAPERASPLVNVARSEVTAGHVEPAKSSILINRLERVGVNV